MRKFICLLLLASFSSFFTGNTFATAPGGVKVIPTASATVNKDTACAGELIDITLTMTGVGPWIVTGTETVNGGTPNIFYDTIASPFTFQARPDPGVNVYKIIDIIDMGSSETNPGNVGGGDSLVVWCFNLPVATGNITQSSACLGQTIDINLAFTGVGPWQVSGSDSVTGGIANPYTQTISTAAFPFQAIPDIGNNIYKVTSITDLTTGCQNVGNVGGTPFLSINVGPLPDIQVNGLNPTTNLCTGEHLSFGVHFLHGVSPFHVMYKDQFDNTNNMVIFSDTTFIINFPGAGSYSCTFISG